MSEQNLYRIEFTTLGELIVNGTALDLPDMSAEQKLGWALTQVADVHAAMPAGVLLRVEVVDEARLGGMGRLATDVPYGNRLTVQMVKDNADTSRTRRFGDNPSGEVYEVIYGPLYPIPKPLNVSESTYTGERKVWPFGSDEKRSPYVPKEPPPRIESKEQAKARREGKKPPRRGVSKKAIVAGVAIAGLAGVLIVQHNSAPAPYAQVCVNNLSYERLADTQCQEREGQSPRWWYVQPHKKVPAVGDYVTPSTGTFTKPTGDKVAVKTDINPKGVAESKPKS